MGEGDTRPLQDGARRVLGELFRERGAQGTLEYALTVLALLALIMALAAIWRVGEEGGFAALVEQAASHGFDLTGAIDIILY